MSARSKQSQATPTLCKAQTFGPTQITNPRPSIQSDRESYEHGAHQIKPYEPAASIHLGELSYFQSKALDYEMQMNSFNQKYKAETPGLPRKTKR
mmetsp:Transcript_22542/g.34838  ORF Transcript_22542/g.34838 Transcript_22542/m.34838 type:complete len:95 (-) Transcript_22542:471-755(-)